MSNSQEKARSPEFHARKKLEAHSRATFYAVHSAPEIRLRICVRRGKFLNLPFRLEFLWRRPEELHAGPVGEFAAPAGQPLAIGRETEFPRSTPQAPDGQEL